VLIGTVGLARACAPGIGPNAITTDGMPAMDSLARNGCAMVAADYTGMGADGGFPDLIGEGEARSLLDSVRAARQVPGVSSPPRRSSGAVLEPESPLDADLEQWTKDRFADAPAPSSCP
jgi:hypothetical protein